MRSGSQPAKRRDEEVRRSLIGIPAFLKSFCLDLQNSRRRVCRARKCLTKPCCIELMGDGGSHGGDLRDLPFNLISSAPVEENNPARLREQQHAERALGMRTSVLAAPAELSPPAGTCLHSSCTPPADCTAIHKSFHRKDKNFLTWDEDRREAAPRACSHKHLLSFQGLG